MPATIFVVEDDFTLREVTCDILAEAGYDVVPAVNGRDALTLLERIQPDLILSDINMPDMDGYEFYSTLRANPEFELVPFIFVTGRDAHHEVLRGKSLGVEDYLTKPFDKFELLLVIEARLRRAEGMRRATHHELDTLRLRLVEMLNHELRTPITIVKGYVDLVAGSGDQLDPDTLIEYLDAINGGAERLSALVEDLALVIELETGITHYAYRQSRQRLDDLPGLIHSVVTQYTARATEKGVQLHTDVPDNLPYVDGSYPMLFKALAHVIDNAIRFSPHNAVVRIRAGSGHGKVFIAVRDSGPGIPYEEIDAIFDVFYQSHRELAEQQGAGLGLSIARGLVKLHGGDIKVDSQKGRGATFAIVLPIASN